MSTHPREEHDHVVSPVIYVAVLIALMVFLCLTVTAAFVDLDKMISGGRHQGTAYYNMAVAILIAMIKAAMVILFFMHIKYGSRLAWAFAAAGFVWLGIMITLSLSDYFTRNYPPGSPKSAPMNAGPQFLRPEPRHNPEVPGASAAPIRPGLPGSYSFWRGSNS